MGAGAYAEEVAEGPVIEVVPRAQAAPGIGGDLVLGVAVLGQQGLAGLLDVPEDVVLRKLRRLAPEHCVRLHGQLVPGQVRRRLGDGDAQVVQGIVDGLVREAVHQVEVEVVEAGAARHVGGADRFLAVVDAPQGLELGRLEALHADGQAIDAELAVGGELGLFEGAGVGFEGDLDVAGEGHPLLDAVQQPADGIGAEQAGGAAAEEDGGQLAAVDVAQVLLQVIEQGIYVGFFRQLGAGGVRVEVAVGALAHAPGDMDVQSQGRELESRAGG
ncbi:hypothetical protein D3C78_663910 [compost metagenome]